jgi:hypothetical protein
MELIGPARSRTPKWHAVRTRGADANPSEHARTSTSEYDRVAPRVRTWSGQVRTRGAHAPPVRSYCFTVETELIGPAMLNGAPPKHDDMQCVAYVPEMSHFHAQMGRIFADQLTFADQLYQ